MKFVLMACLVLGSCRCQSTRIQRELDTCIAEKEAIVKNAESLRVSCSEMWVGCQQLYEDCTGAGPGPNEASN